jgi:hypothetical protein
LQRCIAAVIDAVGCERVAPVRHGMQQ